MAKLNYDRDVRPVLLAVKGYAKTVSGVDLSLRETSDGWDLCDGKTVMYHGTLREGYCYLCGIQSTMKTDE